jgi:hypothetical protein
MLVPDGGYRLRECPRCGEIKALDQFPKKGTQRNGKQRYSYCKPCHSDYRRGNKLRNIFNLTVEQYDLMFDHQGGLCAICLRPPATKRLHVDHDHATGLIRGLVCWNCNKTLGFWRDDSERFVRAASYLSDPPAVHALGGEVYGRKGKTTNKRGKRRAA